MKTNRYYAAFIVLVITASVVVALVYVQTYQRKYQLTKQLLSQQQQLQRLSSVENALSALPPLTPSVPIPQLEWLLAEWADELSLQLTLQYEPTDKPSYRATITGSTSQLHQYLESYISFTRKHQPTAYTHQLLSWRRGHDGQGQLTWHFSQNSTHASIKPPPTVTAIDNDTSCYSLPGFLTQEYQRNLPEYKSLRLIAVVRNRAEPGAAQAYFSNAKDHWLALQQGDWLQQPLTQITAISDDKVSLQQWRQQSQCWLNQNVELQLKDFL
ncbi:MAG: hypothetical protein ACQEQ8_07515 [Pseudomonadota bacterium]